MAYCTEADYIAWRGREELLQLTDHDRAGEIDSAVFNAAQADAAAFIDACLAPRYTLPFASVPAVLRSAALKLVRYELHGDMITDRIAKDRDDAEKLIRAIGRGEISIGIDQAGSQPAPTGGEAYIESGGHTFARADNAFI
jgi:phage gp36-like protein